MVAIARVLSVDDEEFMIEIVRRVVSKQRGLRFVGALESADDLVREVGQNHADLIVLDLNMPGKDPIEAIREVCHDEPSTRVVVLSGHCDPSLIHRALSAGAIGFISKDEPLDVIASELCRASEGHPVLSPLLRQSVGLPSLPPSL